LSYRSEKGDIFFYAGLGVPEHLEAARVKVAVATEMEMKVATMRVVMVKAAAKVKAVVVKAVAAKVEQTMELV
jgi:hypothetical protein